MLDTPAEWFGEDVSIWNKGNIIKNDTDDYFTMVDGHIHQVLQQRQSSLDHPFAFEFTCLSQDKCVEWNQEKDVSSVVDVNLRNIEWPNRNATPNKLSKRQ